MSSSIAINRKLIFLFLWACTTFDSPFFLERGSPIKHFVILCWKLVKLLLSFYWISKTGFFICSSLQIPRSRIPAKPTFCECQDCRKMMQENYSQRNKNLLNCEANNLMDLSSGKVYLFNTEVVFLCIRRLDEDCCKGSFNWTEYMLFRFIKESIVCLMKNIQEARMQVDPIGLWYNQKGTVELNFLSLLVLQRPIFFRVKAS